MKIKTRNKKETRTLSWFLKDKLNISLREFARQEGEKENTLSARWKRPTGKLRIMNAVFIAYVMQYEEFKDYVRRYDDL